MGVAAYQRGNEVIRRQIDADLKARPQAAKGFERDRGMRECLRVLEQRLQRALRRFRLACLEKDAERRRAAAILEAVERTYAEARAAGVRPGPALYWLALARHRAHGADPSAQPAAQMYDEPQVAAVEVDRWRNCFVPALERDARRWSQTGAAKPCARRCRCPMWALL